MSEIAMNAAHMIDMLPDPDKNLAYELIKKLVLAWIRIHQADHRGSKAAGGSEGQRLCGCRRN